ncbi:MAG: hypothetical protein FWC43_07425, partial [Planctomycetaceae bacterium]|nr:hypothetical protein [Planctomycetaceae bacterium]
MQTLFLYRPVCVLVQIAFLFFPNHLLPILTSHNIQLASLLENHLLVYSDRLPFFGDEPGGWGEDFDGSTSLDNNVESFTLCELYNVRPGRGGGNRSDELPAVRFACPVKIGPVLLQTLDMFKNVLGFKCGFCFNKGIRSRRLRSQRRDRIILADNCSEVKKAEQAHAE